MTRTIVLFLLFALAHASHATPLPPAKSSAVDAAVKAQMAQDQAVGIAIGIIQNDEVTYLKGYGWANRETREPVDNTTMFRWASCSKPVTAIAALQLAEKGKLDLDADVRNYVREFPDKGVIITPRELLCHQSGIVHYANGQVIVTKAVYDSPHPFVDPVIALDKFKESPLLFPPRTRYSYSSYGYLLLSAVIQRAGQEPFAEQVQKRIAQPLGLTTFQIDYPWVAIPHRAAGYRQENGQILPSSDTDMSWKAGAGCFISDIGDFTGFAVGLLKGGLVNRTTQATMWQPQKTADGKPTNYGLGFGVQIGADGRLKIDHDGKQEKSRTRFILYPQGKNGVVVMCNSEWVEPGKYSTAIYAALGKP